MLPKKHGTLLKNWYLSSHFSEITKSGAVSLPMSMKELLHEIEDALIFPNRRQKERQKLSQKMMPDLPTADLIKKSIKQFI